MWLELIILSGGCGLSGNVCTCTTLYSLNDHVIWTLGVQLAGMLRLADVVEAAHSLYWLWSEWRDVCYATCGSSIHFLTPCYKA
jgi:hypothetical protein